MHIKEWVPELPVINIMLEIAVRVHNLKLMFIYYSAGTEIAVLFSGCFDTVSS